MSATLADDGVEEELAVFAMGEEAEPRVSAARDLMQVEALFSAVRKSSPPGKGSIKPKEKSILCAHFCHLHRPFLVARFVPQ
jgi:hypothetical protein